MAIKKKRCRENNKGGMITSVCMYGKSKLYFSNISWVGAESAPTYNKQRVQGKSPLLEQHLDGDISNAYLAVNLRSIKATKTLY